MPPSPTASGRPGHHGFTRDPDLADQAWVREEASIQLPPLSGGFEVLLEGRWLENDPEARFTQGGWPDALVGIEGGEAIRLRATKAGPWTLRLRVGQNAAKKGARLRIILENVALGNALAWLGRISKSPRLKTFRSQARNRRLRFSRLSLADGSSICEFSQPGCALDPSFLRTSQTGGINVIGWLDRHLGIGEGARCMLRAAQEGGIPSKPVLLEIPCLAEAGDREFSETEAPLERVNIFHADPQAAPEIARRHAAEMRAARWNIAYWAWELGEFPDGWMHCFEPFDEIWCPSEFCRQAIAAKSPKPVLAMPHAIRPPAFTRPDRQKFGLSEGAKVFLLSYDLNSHTERKNPEAGIEAFKRSGLGSEAELVIKVHNATQRREEFEKLKRRHEGNKGLRFIDRTLSREDMNTLLASCDALVSLHRAEGFGLAVAEAMALGKAVICTDWSATHEFVTPANGLPVRYTLRPLDRTVGPYSKGALWAEADPEHAAEQMHKVVNDGALIKQLGETAKQEIQKQFSPSVVAARYRQRLDAISLFS